MSKRNYALENLNAKRGISAGKVARHLEDIQPAQEQQPDLLEEMKTLGLMLIRSLKDRPVRETTEPFTPGDREC